MLCRQKPLKCCVPRIAGIAESVQSRQNRRKCCVPGIGVPESPESARIAEAIAEQGAPDVAGQRDGTTVLLWKASYATASGQNTFEWKLA